MTKMEEEQGNLGLLPHARSIKWNGSVRMSLSEAVALALDILGAPRDNDKTLRALTEQFKAFGQRRRFDPAHVAAVVLRAGVEEKATEHAKCAAKGHRQVSMMATALYDYFPKRVRKRASTTGLRFSEIGSVRTTHAPFQKRHLHRALTRD